ncbi:MAG: hypothetical protein IPG76_18490 [Acidobacteria bacterium]|nr:hypothetical protein [Acidobacteriota bacterium]
MNQRVNITLPEETLGLIDRVAEKKGQKPVHRHGGQILRQRHQQSETQEASFYPNGVVTASTAAFQF